MYLESILVRNVDGLILKMKVQIDLCSFTRYIRNAFFPFIIGLQANNYSQVVSVKLWDILVHVCEENVLSRNLYKHG